MWLAIFFHTGTSNASSLAALYTKNRNLVSCKIKRKTIKKGFGLFLFIYFLHKA